MIFEERCVLIARHSRRCMNGSNLVLMESIQRIRAANPNRAVTRRKHRIEFSYGNPLAFGKAGNLDIMETINTSGCGNPNVSLTILEEPSYAVTGKTIRAAEVVHPLSRDPIDAPIGGAYPKRVVTVQGDG